MRYHVLACDYDGTLALNGRVDEPTLAALERLLATGRKLVMVTGRELSELLSIFPQAHFFARIVAENGALLYTPATREQKLLASAPPEQFLQALRLRGVHPNVGRVVVATWRPQEIAVFETIRDLNLDWQVIFNKDAVMALPAGVNKATGLLAALEELGLSPHEAVGVGDAENDLPFLKLCECSAVVDNALPALKQQADILTKRDHGAGVAELIDLMVADDLAAFAARLRRHDLLLGWRPDGAETHLPAFGANVLIAGPSGSGKSSVATSLLERLSEHAYQFCIIDPEGDYENLEGAVALGGAQHVPTADDVLQVFNASRQSMVVNLIGMPVTDRPAFFLAMFPRFLETQAQSGRPHWFIVDEAHHLLPATWEPGPRLLPRQFKRTLFITVHPDLIAHSVLETVDWLIAVGQGPEETVAAFCKGLGAPPPDSPLPRLGKHDVLLWSREKRSGVAIRVAPSRTQRRRHTRKYAAGELPPDRSFYFRGPEAKLNLRAQNLHVFLQMADGVDDDTWRHHFAAGDFSTWFREAIKDDALADQAAELEREVDVPAAEGRKRLRALIEQYYTLPAAPTLPMPGTDAAPLRRGPDLSRPLLPED